MADALEAALGGNLLIQASAGTGKTYALTTLVARLLVEQERTIDQLLAVTFTVAATGELRDRVRKTLQNALTALEGGDAGDQAESLTSRWREIDLDARVVKDRLTAAVRDFDRANIMTIHGFCQRVLTEFAFDGGIPFGFEVSGDDAAEVAAAVRDFWRRRIVALPEPLIERAEEDRFTLAEISDWVKAPHAKPDLIVCGVDERVDLRGFEAKYETYAKRFAKTRALWSRHGDAFLAALAKLKWRANSGDKMARVCAEAAQAFAADDPSLLKLADAGYLGRESLEGIRLRRGPELPESPLLKSFDALGEAAADALMLADALLRKLRREVLEDLRKTLGENAWRQRRLSFNALLTEVDRALSGPAGDALARRVRARYPLALIDEYQDTDSLQARIFDRIYAAEGDDADLGGATGLVVVGDPKQSIYRFRGADVFAYMKASRRPDVKEIRLAENYRSTPALVRAVNAVFARKSPFLLPAIEFETATAAEDRSDELKIADDDCAALQFRLLPRTDDKRATKSACENRAARLAAGEVAALLRLADSGAATLKCKPLSGGDIAVLVRTGDQGLAMVRELRELGVQSVQLGDVNVFETVEADELHRLLYALVDEGSHDAAARLRGAVGSVMFGLDLASLAALRDDDREWALWQARFREWREIWQRAGVATLIRQLLLASPTKCASTVMRLADGPRRLTNILHLADLLRQAETHDRLAPAGVVEWFGQRRRHAERSDETAQLRLESDERLVKIVTVHRSKGLEFPIVFCPFAWHGRRGAHRWVKSVEYHDLEQDDLPELLHLDPSKESRHLARVEDQSEELRLLYVALTRAKYRCVVTWAEANDAEYAPLAWLLHGRELGGDTPADALEANAKYLKGLASSQWLKEVECFVAKHADVISSRVAPATDESPLRQDAERGGELTARAFDRALNRVRQVTSYSALVADAGAADSVDHTDVELADHDQREDAALAAAGVARWAHAGGGQSPVVFNPGGAGGVWLHGIIVKRIKPDVNLDSMCRQALTRRGMDPTLAPKARVIVNDVRNSVLSADAERRFRVADLRRPVAEMQFQLPVAGLVRERLGEAIEGYGYGNPLAGSGSDVIDGFLHGFIDLVAEHRGRWYIVDYKSNWLGDTVQAYSPSAIARAMRRGNYQLQYLLYLTALHRYLGLRLSDYDYDTHVGGVFYLFVRGMRPARPGHGVYFDAPARACIDAIDACFRGTR